MYKILEEKIKQCRKCHLRDTCTQVVPGEGSFKADIMFIGEGPGENEDRQGRPFVGAAGKFLEEMLALIGKKREDVFIGNVLKCRPPGNRDPMPEEVEACWPWMMEQIKIIKPKLIVLLGRHAMERFLPGQKISKIHGTALRREIPEIGRQVFYAMYHPAAALYQGSLRETLKTDFKKIPKVIEAIEKGDGPARNVSLASASSRSNAGKEKNRFEEEKKQEALF
jgi:uracil-DNA glycosylase family 4